MYNGFFGFREKPFKLIPNPEFLFLGKSHEEALAHLTYATSQGDGFVEITGEVGTGKTTLCRVFLEDLDKNIEIAYIFNSKLNATQLLKTIHTELGIDFSSEDPVDLTNTLNQFLLEKKSSGKSVILLIDEAQHLGSDTLEQLRLLSNLETTKSKLLQIILVGQPELGDILDSFDMRQLRQRINLSCHILPLTLKETREYVEHRVKVASHKSRDLFTGTAKRLIYEYSQGIPRRINIVCDRSLLVAYSLGKETVSDAIVKIALKELNATRYTPPVSKTYGKAALWAAGLVIFTAVILVSGYFFIFPNWSSSARTEKIADVKDSISSTEPSALPKKPGKMTEGLVKKQIGTPGSEKKPLPLISEEFAPLLQQKTSDPDPKISKDTPDLKTIDTGFEREEILSHILPLWGISPTAGFEILSGQIENDRDFFRIAGMQHNLLMLHTDQGINSVEKFNFPAVLKLKARKDTPKKYIVLIQITTDDKYVVLAGESKKAIRINKQNLLPLLDKDMFITCKNIFGYTGVIAEGSPKFSVLSVKLLLRKIGYPSIDLSPEYNDAVKDAVKHIQAKHGLVEDGLVGRRTKLVFIKEENEASTPFLKPKVLSATLNGGIE